MFFPRCLHALAAQLVDLMACWVNIFFLLHDRQTMQLSFLFALLLVACVAAKKDKAAGGGGSGGKGGGGKVQKQAVNDNKYGWIKSCSANAIMCCWNNDRNAKGETQDPQGPASDPQANTVVCDDKDEVSSGFM